MQYALKLAGMLYWAGGPTDWLVSRLNWPRSNCVVSLQGDWQMDVDPRHLRHEFTKDKTALESVNRVDGVHAGQRQEHGVE